MILKGYAHQVAGHKEEALLGINHRLIMKPMVKKDLFARESAFYKETQENTHNTNSAIRFTPKFFGILYCGVCHTYQVGETGNNGEGIAKPTPLPHIVLEDLTYGFNEPNVIDIKMGTCTFEPTATQRKKDNEVKKYPFQAELGFRITGFKLLEVDSGNVDLYGRYLKAGKPFGRSVQPSEVTAALAMLFRCGRQRQQQQQQYRCDVIRAVIVQLEAILTWMRSQTGHKFFCSSILLVYDAHYANSGRHIVASSDGDSECKTPTPAECASPKIPVHNKADYSSLNALHREIPQRCCKAFSLIWTVYRNRRPWCVSK
jgi:hypothetical protein